MADVHVIGAGPAGSIAALSALRSGHGVTVSEEHPQPGLPRNCSGLFSREGLESLSPFLDYRRHVQNAICGADIHFAGERISVRRNHPVAYVCDRAGMDLELSRRAESEGAELRFNERVRDSFLSKNIIGADGPHSSVALRFGFPRMSRFIFTLQAEIPYRVQDPRMIEMRISGSLYPGFFAWVIPGDECTAEFGVGVSDWRRASEAWGALLKAKGVPSPASRPRGFVIPIRARRRTAMRRGGRNVLLAGDAAGQVKSTTGGGVVFGGGCAAIAGRRALEPHLYELEWRSRFGPDLAMHRAIQSFVYSRTDPQLEALCRRLKKMNIDGYLSRHGDMDRPTRMLRPQLLAHAFGNLMGVASL